jgi:hypothetical protein
MFRIVIAVCVLLFSGYANAQGSAPGQYNWEEFGKRIKASQTVSPLGSNMFGDGVSLSNGALSFSATDVSLPGNNSLPVAFGRSYSVFNRKDYISDGMLADWNLVAPNMNAVFVADWLSTAAGASGARCSNFTGAPMPSPSFGARVADFWQGINLDIPGVGSDEVLATNASTTKPTDGATYRWMTNGQIHISCLSTTKNETGEGFLAVAPDGTKYWFDWMSQYSEAPLKQLISGNDWAVTPTTYHLTPRKKNVLYATRVEDRFGNWVEYTYSNAWNQPGMLVSIKGYDRGQATPSRTLTVGYTGNLITSVSNGTSSWTYAYGDTTSGRKTLTMVTQPDQSKWNINFAGFTNAEIKYNEVPMGEILRTCTMMETPLNYALEPVGTITHPSGATGTFTVNIQEHGRSNVPVNCGHVSSTAGPGTAIGNNPNDDVNLYPISSHSFTLKQKTVTGTGLGIGTWNYSYDPNISVYYNAAMGVTHQFPVCMPYGDPACSAPVCTSQNCGTSKTTVIGPDGVWERHSYGNSYRNNEGKLVKVERGTSSSNVLSSTSYQYDFSLVNQAYPASFGTSLRGDGDGFPSTFHRPLYQKSTLQQGVTFTWEVPATCISGLRCFNEFAHPTKVSRFSSPGSSRTDDTEYEQNPTRWVIGQVKKETLGGIVAAEATYDPVTASQLTYKSFSKLLQTLTYNADGTVATVKDGNNNVTTLSNWKAGIPRLVTFPATAEAPAGATQSAVVNNLGWIDSVTNEMGATTGYSYDVMGRLSQITYPTGNTPAWLNTTLAFSQLTAAENGMPAGYWRHSTSTGNARKIVYLDAQWRPAMTWEYDNGSVAATQRFQRFTYDFEGRPTFASYPASTTATSTGTFTFYDALGRVTKVSQDSEFGASQPINTLTDYLANFITSTTNPLGQVTLTSFLTFDQPTQDWPLLINHPENQLTTITRDLLGKPTSLIRSGTGLSVTRSYTYDDGQRLCVSVEPETAASVVQYDAAGNVSWTASGQPFNSTTSCATARAGSANSVLRSYDARNRLSTLVFPDGRGNQTWSYRADGLPAQITTNNASGGDQVVNSYTYNNRGMLVGEGMSQPGSTAWPLGYSYDANGSLAGVSYPSALYVAYAPNALGQATQAGTYATGVQYYPNGAIKQFTYGNGIVHTMTQNARQLPVRSTDVGGGTALDLAYAFDKNSNVSSITDYVDGRQTRTMTYDGLDRLLTTSSVMFGGDNLARYTYDTLDNIKTLKVGGNRDHTYSYGATNNQLLNVLNTAGGASVVGLAYDVRGNVINKNGQVFDFDYGNRLRAAVNKENYRYDGHGRRVRANSPTLGNILSMYGQDGVLRRQEDWRTGKLTDYIYLGGSQVARVSNAPTLSAPTVTVPSYNTAGSYTVQWTTVASATRYELEEQVDAGAWSPVYSGTALSFGVSGKTSGSYGYRARGCLAAVCGAWSAIGTVAVQLPPVLAPSLSVPATALNGNFTVTWGTVSGATSYTLEQSANGGAWTVSYTGSALSKAYSNIGTGSFSYRVKACNPAGCGDLSGVGVVQALYPPGSAPGVSAPAQSLTGSYTVSWSAVGTATSYRLEESVNGGGWTQIQDAAATSRAMSGKPAGTYSYRALACNAAGCSGYSGAATTQVVLAPTGAPSLSAAPTTATTGAYTVSWSAVSTATTYRLEESFNGGGWAQILDAATTSWGASGKAAGTYAYRALGCNVAGCGGYSNTGTVTVPPPAPATPSFITVTYTLLDSPTRTRYKATWGASSGATSYELQGSMSYTGTATTYNQTYTGGHVSSRQFYVRACNANGCSAWTAAVTAVPL